MSNCLNCNFKVNKKNFEINFISSDVDILNFKTNHAFCEKCGLLQKYINNNYKRKINIIYKNYLGFKKFNFKDQRKFIGNTLGNRCELLYKKFLKKKKYKKILDFGSSNGAMLYPFIKTKTDLYATDLKNNISNNLKKNKNFKKFINLKSLYKTKLKFNLITLIHVFEHLTEPKNIFLNLEKILSDDGKIFLQIPNYKKNPADLAIYDHTAHYDKHSIINFFSTSNFKIDRLEENYMFGEFTIVLSKKKIKPTISNYKKVKHHYKKELRLLKTEINKVKKLKNFSILGTSVNSTFFYSYNKKNMKNFFDEDEVKIQKLHIGKKILRLQDNQKHTLFLPFFGQKKINIMRRLKKEYSYNLK